jgi:hypothetical protein
MAQIAAVNSAFAGVTQINVVMHFQREGNHNFHDPDPQLEWLV